MSTLQRQQESIELPDPVNDIVVRRSGQGAVVQPHIANGRHFYRPAGNLIVYIARYRLSGSALKHIMYYSAVALSIAHANRMTHGNIGENSFHVDAQSVTLLNVGIGAQARRHLDRIYWSPSHDYKARAELIDDTFIPSQVADLHSWGKVMVALFIGRPFRASLNPRASTIGKPHEVPDDVWNIVVQVLDENLNIHVDIQHIVNQLAAII